MQNKTLIKDKEYWGERPLYTLHDACLENVSIHTGESAIKESGNIEAATVLSTESMYSGNAMVSAWNTACSSREHAVRSGTAMMCL